jgi:hypothetical protein
MEMAKNTTVTVIVEENDPALKDFQKYTNKAKTILNGNHSSNNSVPNIKITKDSIIVKKLVHQ